MYELGYSFEYKQKGLFSVIFDLDNQIVLYKADKHLSKKTLVIFSRLISESEENFDFATKVINVEDLKNSDLTFLFYKNINVPALKSLIASKNKNILNFESISKNWIKIYEKEEFKLNLFKSLEVYIEYHNFNKYLSSFELQIKHNEVNKFMGDSYSSTYLKGVFLDKNIENKNDHKNNDKFSDEYITKLLEFSVLLEKDPINSQQQAMEIIGNQKKYSKNNIKNEKLKFLHNAVENYNSELHIKHILAKKILYDLSLEEYPKIKLDLSFFSQSLIKLFVQKLDKLNNKEKLLLQITSYWQ